MIGHVLKERVVGLVGLQKDASAHVGTDRDQAKVVEEREGLDLEPVKVLHDLHANKDRGQVSEDDQKNVEGVHQGQLGDQGGLDGDQESTVVVDQSREVGLHLGSEGVLNRIDKGGSPDTEGPGKVDEEILWHLGWKVLCERLHFETNERGQGESERVGGGEEKREKREREKSPKRQKRPKEAGQRVPRQRAVRCGTIECRDDG